MLKAQIAMLRPRTIVTLGKDVPRLLARLSPELVTWRKATTFRALDATGPLVHRAGVGEHAATTCALAHPS